MRWRDKKQMTYKQKIEANIWKYTVLLICNKRTFITILGVYFLTFPSVEVQTVGLIMSIGSLVGFLLEIPSGYISDKVGHKRAIVISRISSLASTSLFLVGTNIWIMALGVIMNEIAHAFLSGTGTAFFQETLQELKKERQHAKIHGKVKSIGFTAPIPLIIAVPFLVEISFKVPFMVAVAIDIVGLVAAISLVQPRKSKAEIKEIGAQNYKSVLEEIHKRGFTSYMVYGAIVASFVAALSRFREIYQESIGIPVVFFGLLWGVSRVIIASTLPLNHHITERISFEKFLLLKNSTTAILIGILAFVESVYITIPILILITSIGLMFSSAKSHYQMQIIGKSNFKATIISTANQLRQIMVVISVALGGYIISQHGYQYFFAVLSIGMLLVTVWGQLAIRNRGIKV